MPLISESIPNLVNGVSQQPPSLKLKTQAALQENGFSTVVDGLRKRPPTEHIAKLIGVANLDTAFIHTIRRDENEFYILVITPDAMFVYDAEGNPKPLTGNLSYLSGLTNPAEEITATSIADYTFIVNKTKTVTQGTAKTATRPKEALVYVKQGDYLTDFIITIKADGVTYKYTKITKDASVSANQGDVKTNLIAEHLRTAMVSTTLPTGTTASGGVLPTAKFSTTLYGNVIYIRRVDSGDFTVEVEDSRGNSFMKAVKGQIANFLDLPPNGLVGFKVKVIGDDTQNEDDYWVELQTPDGGGTPVWKETIAPNIVKGFNLSTMPHQLVKQTDGSFKFEQGTWAERIAGDDATNSFPTFTDAKINDVFFHRNRLGFLSDENVIFSEAGQYYNFFLTTVVTSLDSSPIDVAVSNNQVSILKHAIPFNESLLMFSDLTQFALRAGDILTPDSVSVDVTTQFEASLKAKPVGAGRFVFFATRRGRWAGVREFFIEQNSENANALEVTSHIPRYLDGEIHKLAASSNEETLLALTKGDPHAMYIYRYYWSATEKLQSSWSRWVFDGKVINCDFNGSDIYLLIQRDDGITLERINLSRDESRAETVNEFPVLLDRRVRIPADQAPASFLPYVDENVIYVRNDGKVLTPAEASEAQGALVFAGIPYRFRYRFSEAIVKQENEPVTIGRLQLRSMALVYSDTGYFEVEVSPKNRTPSRTKFTGRKIGEITNTLGYIPLESGTFKVAVLSKSDQVTIDIISDSHLPCAFQSAEWEGYYTLRSQRQ